MKRYSILRKNHEFGPFTAKELKTLGLAPSDLIWIEEESNCWQSPDEIPALQPLAEEGIKQPLTAPSAPAYPTQTQATHVFDERTNAYLAALAQEEEPLSWRPQQNK